MDRLTIGVIGLQGDVEEHRNAFEETFSAVGRKGRAVWVRRPADLEEVDGLALPGGESTTISKLLTRFDLRDRVLEMAEGGSPILGTCAGCVLLAKKGDEQVRKTGTELLSLMDMEVARNAYGSQRESFETILDIEGIGEYPGVFIRAPAITDVWDGCRPLAVHDGRIVLARQGKLIAASFHPELTSDHRFHEMFLDLF